MQSGLSMWHCSGERGLSCDRENRIMEIETEIDRIMRLSLSFLYSGRILYFDGEMELR